MKRNEEELRQLGLIGDEKEKKPKEAAYSKEEQDSVTNGQNMIAALGEQSIGSNSMGENLKVDSDDTSSFDDNDDDSFFDAINELPGIGDFGDLLPAMIEAQSSGLIGIDEL